MGKYDKHFPKLSEEQKEDIRYIIQSGMKDTRGKDITDDPIFGYYITCYNNGVDALDSVLVGPFTAKEFLDAVGMDMKKYPDVRDRARILRRLDESWGTLKFDIKKNQKGLYTVEYSQDAKDEMDKLKETDGKYKLNKWDKFCAFFGIKTDHARSVEANLAGLEAYKEKHQELTKRVMSVQMSDKRKQFLETYAAKQEENKKLSAETKKQFDGWKQVFFGEKEVPDYIMNDGKKISAISICMAALQQRTKMDLSSMEPKDFASQLNLEENAKLKERVEQIGKTVDAMASTKASVLRRGEAFRNLDKFLFEKNNDISGFDANLKDILKVKNPRQFTVPAAATIDNKNMEAVAKTAVMFKAKNDMLKLFGKDDQIFSMKGEDGKPLDKAAADLENHIKTQIKSVNVYKAIENKDYDQLLKITGVNDYAKLDEAFDLAEGMMSQANMNKQMEDKDLEDDFEM